MCVFMCFLDGHCGNLVLIAGQASSFLLYFVCTLKGWSFQKQNRKEEEEEGETEQQ